MNIFVAKLSSRTKGEDLEKLFSQFGEVTSAKVIFDRNSGFSKRYGFVEMTNEQEAFEAIDKLNDTELDGSQIVVKLSVPRTENKSPRRTRDNQDED
jgi:RNA recognition motif-containing protein